MKKFLALLLALVMVFALAACGETESTPTDTPDDTQTEAPEATEPVEEGGDEATFLPGGGAEWAYEDNPLEKVYYVLEGEMTVTDKDGKKYVIHKDESISFPPNEGRGLLNESNLPARMLVIINYPEA